jgi:hypothetical protein
MEYEACKVQGCKKAIAKYEVEFIYFFLEYQLNLCNTLK